jgi:hypothetical protein
VTVILRAIASIIKTYRRRRAK